MKEKRMRNKRILKWMGGVPVSVIERDAER